jgi:hypothetical protein
LAAMIVRVVRRLRADKKTTRLENKLMSETRRVWNDGLRTAYRSVAIMSSIGSCPVVVPLADVEVALGAFLSFHGIGTYRDCPVLPRIIEFVIFSFWLIV